jgi:hypothetical protein
MGRLVELDVFSEWWMAYEFRQVRSEGPIAAPCGCVGEDQFNFDVGDATEGYVGCCHCQATWAGAEGGDWQHGGVE